MGLLVIMARRLGREYDVTMALALAGFLMLFHNPKILAFDVSFELSFLATIGLIFFSPLIAPYFRRVPARFGLRDVALATVSTQLFVLPFILYKMGGLSVVALPVNLLVLLFIPSIMFLGFITGIIGFVSGAIAAPFAFAASLLLGYVLLVTESFAGLPFASLSIPPIPLVIVAVAYGCYAFVIYRNRRIA
ncbi:ComEC/Rec2 family competence protein [Candidatus Parcubacteria bacterium]|nr:ComEC/Rec2 family competence protein [Candidatus Parcubacteria bacterium]